MTQTKKTSPKVFISYYHESNKHKNNVLRLANILRRYGIDCDIDQYHASPPEGWARWMVKQIRASDYVILVCTEGYMRRFEGKEKGGAEVEGKLITQEYLMEGKRDKYIPVIFSPDDARFIPFIFKDVTFYDLSRHEGIKDLYSHLTGQQIITKPQLGKIIKTKKLYMITQPEFPLLEQAIEKTKTITVKGIDGQRYYFHLFPFGERGSILKSELREEIILGLRNLVEEIGEDFDYVLGIKEGGFSWADHVARELNKPSVAIYEKETERGGKEREKRLKGERTFHLKTILYEKDLYFRGLKAGDKVVIIDDVISSGQTMAKTIEELKKIGVEVIAALCIVAKGDGYKKIESQGVRVRWLQFIGLA